MDSTQWYRYDPDMPLPEEQLDRLREGAKSHGRRLAQLHEVVRLAEEEAAVHQVLLDLATNASLIAAIGNCYDDPELVSRFARDPAEYCRRHDIQLPEGVMFHSVAADSLPTGLAAQVRRGAWEVQVAWDRDEGFSSRPDTRRVRQVTGVVNYVDLTPIEHARDTS
jgi:hypothetical protein